MKVMEMKLRYRKPRRELPKASSSKAVAGIVRDYLKRKGLLELQEVVCVIPLDNALNVLGIMELTRGTISSCQIDLRQLMASVLVANARGFILAHNHPSGRLSPSTDDITLTSRVNEASKVLELEFCDHLIITRKGYTSFADKGLIS